MSSAVYTAPLVSLKLPRVLQALLRHVLLPLIFCPVSLNDH